MNDHPTRQQLLKAVETGRNDFTDHLDQCVECRELFEVLTAFHVTGEQRLEHAPSAWIDKAIALADKKRLGESVRKLVAKISFDSWSASPALGVRGPASDRRRLRFSAGDLQLDLQAVKKRQQWDFVAHIAGSQASEPAELRVGSRTMAPDDDGYITWHSVTPPKQMSVISGETTIELPQLSWDEPRT